MPAQQTYALLAAVLLVGLAGGGFAAAAVVDAPDDTANGEDRLAGAPVAQSTNDSTDYQTLYDETIDSVVTIRVETDRGTARGSGFVYDDQGRVVTNQHVVAGGGDVMVRFSDDTWRQASVVGTDRFTDLAVLEVEDPPAFASPLPVASSRPDEGQQVAALGSPFGLEGTITTGVVSGVNRSMPTESDFSIPATVQTDAAINPGNSGGPLVSTNGTVVGVNRAKQGDNVGYAISAAVVGRIVPELIRNGSYDHSYVGIRSVPVTPTVAEANDLDEARGVHVVGVVRGGPADGVLEPATDTTTVNGRTVRTGGDVVLAIEGESISSHQELSRILMLQTESGDTITLTVLRDGERTTVELTLGERPTP